MTIKEHLIVWRNALKESFSLDSILAAAGTAYFAFFSFFPLILLLVAVASRWFDPLWVESELIARLEFIVPGVANLLGKNIAKVIEARFSATATALILLAWASSSLFSIITRILDRIWSGEDVRSRMRYRGLALLLVGILSIVVLTFLFISIWIIPLLKSILPEFPLLLYQNLGFLLSVLVNIILFVMLYRFLPHASPNWHDIWIGATAAGTIWAIAKRFFVGYTARFLSTSNLVYGSVSTIIAFLVWVYFSGLIFFFGAYLGKGYRQHKLAKEEEIKNPIL
ncbi:MAG: hypothetical protein DRI32_00845 [Chloroflexi bacterium]|nr:MAG: hypothetical protein DRI32_00845 [Chloroflexota bacterium]